MQKTQQYVNKYSFGHLLTITHSFAKLPMRHTSFRKTLNTDSHRRVQTIGTQQGRFTSGQWLYFRGRSVSPEETLKRQFFYLFDYISGGTFWGKTKKNPIQLTVHQLCNKMYYLVCVTNTSKQQSYLCAKSYFTSGIYLKPFLLILFWTKVHFVGPLITPYFRLCVTLPIGQQ